MRIAGKPLILHTVERSKKAKTVDHVIVATDDKKIFESVADSGNEAVMTSTDHKSGSDRVAEVAEALPTGSIIVNVQGDEPLISPDTIDAAVETLLQGGADIVTACEPLTSLYSELLNFNVVKAVAAEDGRALYFSRSPMPFPRNASLRYDGDPNRALASEPELFANYRKHTGIYAYRREYLLEFAKLPQSRLEKFESLEQLRALEHGSVIKIVNAKRKSIGVDTVEDFERVKDIIEAGVDIRPATREDMSRIATVHVESWQRSFAGIAPDEFLANMSVEKRLKVYAERGCEELYSMLVAEDSEKGIVGFADFGTPKLEGNFDAQIYSFYFLPEFQRRGLGERLFRRCVSRLKRGGIASLCLDSLDVSPYRAFYDKMGGSLVGRDSHELGKETFETVIYGWYDISKI